jgi:hypothetical protein
MHFELDVSPAELAVGIDPATVMPLEPPAPADDVRAPSAVSPTHRAETLSVIARDGLRLRTGPSTGADIARVLAFGTLVHVIGREGDWMLVDIEGDGKADGFMSRFFLQAVPATAALGDVTDRITETMVKAIFPSTPIANIRRNLPFVLAGLRARGLGDRAMAGMALATIRAETEGFVPIDEGRSALNTRVEPFDRYEPGTAAGRKLGNTVAGDGALFKGRGYVQLSGRFNYNRIGAQIGADLASDPPAANKPETAGLILAQFLQNGEGAIRAALAADDLESARKCINGGTHGLVRFRDAYALSLTNLPT